MSLPIHTSPTTARPTTLAQAVAQARHPRNHATAQLEAHREELLRLSAAGESAESLVGGLRLIGIEIGRETMRRWLQRELGRRPAKRRRKTAKGSRTSASATSISPVAPLPEVAALAPRERPADSLATPTTATAPRSASVHGGANVPVLEGTRFIRPGETPLEAWNRRQAERMAREAADAAVKATQGAPSGSPVKDT
jgi:hypothetical protein